MNWFSTAAPSLSTAKGASGSGLHSLRRARSWLPLKTGCRSRANCSRFSRKRNRSTGACHRYPGLRPQERFRSVVLGLSGGIDSALTLAIAVDALGAGPGRGGVDALALHRRHQQSGCRSTGRDHGGGLPDDPHRTGLQRLSRHAVGDVCRHPAGYHRREYPGPLPRHHPDGDQQQARPDAADHRQQERDVGRLRHPVRRHGRRLRAAQGRAETAGLPSGTLAQSRERR